MPKLTIEKLQQHVQDIALGYEPQLLELTDLAFQSTNIQPIRLERDRLLHQMRLKQLEPLRVKQPVHLAWFSIDDLTPTLLERIQYAIEVIRLLIPQPREHPDFYLEILDREEMFCEFRFIKSDFSEIYLRRDTPTSVILHELGHWLEESVHGAKQAAFLHLEPRVLNEPVRHLGHGYHPLEYTQPDAFISAYVGKCKADGSRRYTELISSALEYLYKNPQALLLQDPQTATFLFEFLETL